ncbi:hypothetical protein Ancab_028600 [Ancistrocladus abbreviatus]
MEEDEGLDLSLGLPLGASSSKSKEGNRASTVARTDDDDRTSKIVNDFRNFLNGGNPQQDPSIFHGIDAVKPQENFFVNISQASIEVDASQSGKFCIASSKRSVEVEDEKGPVVGEKRKTLLGESNAPKKQEAEAHDSDLHEKAKTSHISITTDDGSTADNEDGVESEVEGSTSRLVTHRDDESKWPAGGVSSSEVLKENGKLTIGAPSSRQPMNALNVPYSVTIKEPASVGVPSTNTCTLPGMMQAIPAVNIELPSTHALNAVNKPVMFRYSTGQLPDFDKSKAWGVARPQPFHPSYVARGISTSGSAAIQSNYDVSEAWQSTEQAKIEHKQVAGEGSSSCADDDTRGSSILRGKAASEVPTSNDFPSEYPAIRPGVAVDIKVGGSGSLPNLPWVSTTCPGPNGRMISGVTYKFNANQIKIVCACHGSHMSPEEFIQHAAEEPPATDATAGLISVTSNPATTARS